MSLWGSARLNNRRVQIGLRIISPIIVLAVWELLVNIQVVDARFFPAPSTIMLVLGRLTTSGEILAHLAATLQRVFLGFLLGSFIGLVIGLMMGWSQIMNNLIDPLIAIFYPMPKLALLPLILIIFGIGETSKIAIIAIAVFFLVVINTAAGVRNIDSVLLDAARNFGARGLRMFMRVVIPAALPTIFTGIRLALGIALVVIVAAEFVASNRGLGYLVWLSWQTLAISKMYAGLIVIGLVGFTSTYFLKWVADRLMPWHLSEERGLHRSISKDRTMGMKIIGLIKQLSLILISYSRQYLYELPNEAELPDPRPSDDDIRFELMTEANVDKISAWKGRWTARRFHTLSNRRMIGIFAYEGDQVIGYAWGSMKTGRFTVSCMQDPVEIGDAFTGTAEVNPAYRRKGVASRLRWNLFKHIREVGSPLGIKRICGAVLVQNTPMQKLIERQGSVRIQEYILIRITPWIFFRWTWDLREEKRRKPGTGRPSVRLKFPEFPWDPLFYQFWSKASFVSERTLQPEKEP